jgi:molecular chaperone DnaK
VVLVGGSSRVPLVRQRVAEYFGKPPRTDVDPDEAVALGAAIQVGLKTGAISAEAGIMITDVSPFTLGLEAQSKAGRQIVQGVFAPVIPRNSTVPVSRTERFSTTADGQKSVTIKVFQGESRYTKNNVFLDEYTLDGVPAAPAGRESIAVTFTYDINGILDVTTEIVSTGKKATLVIDKSPRRMTDGDRSIAKERVEREWGLGAPAVSFATAPVAAPAASGDFVLLVSTARERLGSASGGSRAQLETLLRDADEAVARGDHATITALDTALTDLLFAME